MRCVVLGGAGFLGSHLSEALLFAGHEVTVFEKASASLENIGHIADKVVLAKGDFGNLEDVTRALAGAEVLFHLISTTNPQISNNDPVYDIQSNVVSTLNLLKVARAAGIKKVVFTSSGGTVYGVPTYTPIREDHPTNPICSYGIQKVTIEKYLHMYYHLYGLDYGVLRISNPYGPRQSPIGGQGVIAAFLHRVASGNPVEIWGDGSVVRDYVHVNDVVQAAVSLITYQGREKIFNIGSGAGYSLLEIVKCIESVTGNPVNIDYKGARNVDVPVNILDISRAGSELNWYPSIELVGGLKRLLVNTA